MLPSNWLRGALKGLIWAAPGSPAEIPRTNSLSSIQKPKVHPLAVLLSQLLEGVAVQKQLGVSSVGAGFSGIKTCSATHNLSGQVQS